MSINGTNYTTYIKDNKSPFYTLPKEEKNNRFNSFTISNFDNKNWYSNKDIDWIYMMYKNEKLPTQGWKIHISANIKDAADELYEISKYLILKKISFKFIPNLAKLELTYSKSGDRIEAGKFITIYPRDTEEFCNLLNPLKKITSAFKKGPYILNDEPWQQSNVYFRYGAFKRMIFLKNGTPSYMIKTPSGNFIEDKRVPFFTTPDFIKEPKYIKENNTFPKDDNFYELSKLKIKEAIHFSNSGGVYLGTFDNKEVVIKEGRPNIGLDQKDHDGFNRIKNEYNILKKLNKVTDVVKAYYYMEVWGNNFLIEEKVPGQTLQDYMAINYPFTKNASTNSYKKDAIKIINKLITLISKIHEQNFAFVDFQPENIMINKQKNEIIVKLIDFESSENAKNKYSPNLVAQDYASFNSRTFEEGDWFTLNKIARSLFLPIQTTTIFTPDLEKRQNENIQKKFGNEVTEYLTHVRTLCQKHTNVYRNSIFYKEKMKIPNTKFNRNNIDKNICELKNGLINNLDYNSKYLIHGDIKQFSNPISKYSINNGSMGTIMALVRSGYKLNNTAFKKWLNNCKIDIKKIIDNNQCNNIGLFDGITGIAMALFNINQKGFAQLLMNYCNKEISNTKLDISLYSGLSGIGFANLSIFSETKNKAYKTEAINIAKTIIKRYNNGEFKNQKNYEGKLGLVKGWAGVVLYIWKIGRTLNIKHFIDESIKILNTILKLGVVKADGGMSLSDNSRGFQRLLPYLDTGFGGISLLLIEMSIDDPKLINKKYHDYLKTIQKDLGSFCTYQCSLFSGVAGLIVCSNAVKDNFNNTEALDTFIKSLNNFAVSINGNDSLFPGIFGLKCSMDYETGASGILLSLNDIDNKESWYSWFPLLDDNNINLFNMKKSHFID